MKKHYPATLLVAIILIIGGCQRHKPQQYTIEQFMNTVSIQGSSFSSGETKILLSSNETGIYNAYEIPVEGGQAIQITNSTENSIFAISYFPNDNRILFRGDKGGNEIWHIYLREKDGTVRDLTPGEKARSIFYGWSYDERSFFYGSNARDPRYMDIFEMKIETFTAELIFQNDQGLNLGDISDDKLYMALSETHTRDNSDIYLYDTETQELNLITPHEGDINHLPETFSVDSKSLYYLSDKDSEFQYLMRYNLSTGESEVVQKDEWDIWYNYFSHSGKYRVIGVNEDARTKIHVYDSVAGDEINLPDLPAGDITSVTISKSEKLMAFYHNGATSPSNLYVYNFETEKYKKLTDTMNPEIDPANLAEGEVVRYESFDGLEIPAIYYRPPQASRRNKVPALVWVHGGPGGQSRVGYRALIQYLVNHGYAILAVNNRGSGGYGKTFQRLDDQKHGEGDLDDCVAAKDFLFSTGYVAENKIGIIGGSYGGYMVMAGLAFRPEAFAVGVNIFGVTNWVRTLESIPPWWEAFRVSLYKEMGNPETQKDYLRSISPLFHADKIVRPVIVLQGANDPRVLQVESDEIVEAARSNGVPVEYVVFDDEGHGFVKKENQIKAYRAILDFLETHLKNSPWRGKAFQK